MFPQPTLKIMKQNAFNSDVEKITKEDGRSHNVSSNNNEEVDRNF